VEGLPSSKDHRCIRQEGTVKTTAEHGLEENDYRADEARND